MSYAEAQYTIDSVIKGVKDAEVTGLPPGDPTGIAWVPSASGMAVKGNAHNLESGGVILSKVRYAKLVVTKGPSAATSPSDPMIVAFANSQPIYADVGEESSFAVEVSGLEVGQQYTARVFLMSDHEVSNRSIGDTIKTFTVAAPEFPVYGFTHDFANLDPASCIEYTDRCEGFTPWSVPLREANALDMPAEWQLDIEFAEWVNKIVPIEFNRAEGTATILDGTDLTKTKSGGVSHIEEGSDGYEYYTAIPNFWIHQEISGDIRTVKYIFDPNLEADHYSEKGLNYQPFAMHADLTQFSPYVFVPIFFNTREGTNPGSFAIARNGLSGSLWLRDLNSVEEFIKVPYSDGGTIGGTPDPAQTNKAWFGGSYFSDVIDLLTFFFKTTNLGEAVGYGYSPPEYKGGDIMSVNINETGVFTHGLFYKGTSATDTEVTAPTIVLYSRVLGMQIAYLADPNIFWDETNQQWTLNLFGGDYSFLDAATGVNESDSPPTYSARLDLIFHGDTEGTAIPNGADNSGSSLTGLCGQQIITHDPSATGGSDASKIIMVRFGAAQGNPTFFSALTPVFTEDLYPAAMETATMLLPAKDFVLE